MTEAHATTSEIWAAFTSVPNLETLSYSLRHPETWPEGFVWDYRHCRNCAMGLAAELWNLKNPQTGDYRPWLSRPPFSWLHPFLSRPHSEVTPEHVATAIDAYVASQRRS